MTQSALKDKDKILQAFREKGFEDVKITTPWLKGLHERLGTFLQANHHGEMAWLERSPHKRSSPRYRQKSVRSVLMASMAYTPPESLEITQKQRTQGIIAGYALHKDYHAVIKRKMSMLATWFEEEFHHHAFPFVDTSAMMEKPFAQAAGLGWQGKHTNLVSRNGGSWTLLAGMLTTKILPCDKREKNHCGSCRACLDICPTGAFPKPYVLDAKRCISYLTIEHKGVIQSSLREGIGNRLFGCDDCLQVCPWNQFAKQAKSLPYRDDLKSQPLVRWLMMKPQQFHTLFSNTSIIRTGYERFIRNALIVAGNSGSRSLEKLVDGYLDHSSPLIRGMAVWALGRLTQPSVFAQRKRQYAKKEPDKHVQSEWDAGWCGTDSREKI